MKNLKKRYALMHQTRLRFENLETFLDEVMRFRIPILKKSRTSIRKEANYELCD
jgi:hypothetical protein